MNEDEVIGETVPEENKAASSTTTNSFRKKVFTLIALAGIVCAGAFAYYSQVYKTELSDFELQATSEDVAGVAPSTQFLLTSTAKLSPQILKKYIVTEPSLEYDIRAGEGNTYTITPKESLAVDTVYAFRIEKGPIAGRDFGWAYQVKAPMSILSSVPGNQGTHVPTNTGIEMEFNRQDIEKPESSITIEPSVPGIFEVKGSLVRFIPSQPLAERTVYTVTVRKGLGAKDTNDTLAEDTVIQFETGENYTNPRIDFLRTLSEFAPGAPIVLGVGWNSEPTAELALYRYDTTEAMLADLRAYENTHPWARYRRSDNLVFDESKKVLTVSAVIESSDSYGGYVHVPQVLEQGMYAVVLDSGKSKDVAWIVIHPYASFVAFAEKNSIVWLKDIASGENIANVPLHYDGNLIGVTGSDGVLTFNTPTELIREEYTAADDSLSKRRFVVAKASVGDLIIPIEDQYGSKAQMYKNNPWWSYIYTNKAVYLPTDTLHFWAIQKPREGSMVGEELSVSLSEPSWYPTTENTVYAETKVIVSEANTVTGELSFSNLKPGIYELLFKKDGAIVTRQTVSVSAYIQPAYELTVEPNKNVIFADEPVTFSVRAQFFEGTPVANTDVTYSLYGLSVNGSREGSIHLDENGEGTFTAVYTEHDQYTSYWPRYASVTISPQNAEEAKIRAEAALLVFGPRIANTITQKKTDTQVSFEIQTKHVVLDDKQKVPYYWDITPYLRGGVANIQTNVDIYELEYVAELIRNEYDPINKVTYPIYTYKTVEKPLGTQTVTANGAGTAHFSYAIEASKTYLFKFKTRDNRGQEAYDVRYVYGGYSDYYDEYYYLSDANKVTSYGVGDEIDLSLSNAQRKIFPFDTKTQFIFLAVHNGTIRYQLTDTPYYKSTFTTEDVPNIGVWPGWFKNGRFGNGYLANLSFDANERRLKIEISPDQKSYAPGDTAHLSLKVTDTNGKPVVAEVNVSALDEAVFAISNSERDIVNELYSDIYSPLIIRTSNMPPYGGGGAEKGGGGDDGVRQNFKEQAIFKTVMTNANGEATVDIPFPDNLTSWRVTTQAATSDLYAGKNVLFIPVRAPFFVEATLNKTYLAGDDLIVRLRSFGSMRPSGSISYSAESPTLSFKKFSIQSQSSAEIPVGTLTTGVHDLTLRAGGGTLSDTLVRKILVLGSYFTKRTADHYDGTNGLRLKGAAIGNTTVTFRSGGRGKLYGELTQLSYGQGQRLDQNGIAAVAQKLRNEYFGTSEPYAENFDSTRYQHVSGGIQLLPYSSDELEISALSAHVFSGTFFDQRILKRYLWTALDLKTIDTSRAIRALFGLSVYREPILVDLRRSMNDDSVSIKDRIYLALALDETGDKEGARQYYQTHIQKFIEYKPGYAYISGLEYDETILATTLLAALTLRLDEAEVADKLMAYVYSNDPKETLGTLEEMMYIKTALKKSSDSDVSFTFKKGSEEITKELKGGEAYSLTLTKEDLESFEVVSVTGDLSIVAEYEKEVSPKSLAHDSNLRLSRLYSAPHRAEWPQEGNMFYEGELIKITLIPSFAQHALDGSYQIVDYLPSGLRAVDTEMSSYYMYDWDRVYPVEINDQKVTFIVDKTNTRPVYYYARVVTKGTYKGESAILQSLKNLESTAISNEDVITIK